MFRWSRRYSFFLKFLPQILHLKTVNAIMLLFTSNSLLSPNTLLWFHFNLSTRCLNGCDCFRDFSLLLFSNDLWSNVTTGGRRKPTLGQAWKCKINPLENDSTFCYTDISTKLGKKTPWKFCPCILSDSTFLIREGGTKAQILVQRVGTLDRTSWRPKLVHVGFDGH